MAEKAKQQEQPKTQQIVKFDNISDQVLAKINAFTRDGGLLLPENYSVANNMKSAWLLLQETTDRNGKLALEVCSKASIANALFDMVLQGLSVSKSQGYFIVYGNKLEFQRSYFGTVALAKRSGGIKTEPVANVIYEGDDFIYTIDPKTGHFAIVKHDQKLENIDDNKIAGAYAIVKLADGSTQVTIKGQPEESHPLIRTLQERWRRRPLSAERVRWLSIPLTMLGSMRASVTKWMPTLRQSNVTLTCL